MGNNFRCESENMRPENFKLSQTNCVEIIAGFEGLILGISGSVSKLINRNGCMHPIDNRATLELDFIRVFNLFIYFLEIEM